MSPLSPRAQKVMKIDLVLTVIPALRKAVMEAARDVTLEDANSDDAFFIDTAATEIIHELCNFLTQSNVIVEDEPLIHPRQMSKRYSRVFFGVKK